ncbi:hypothetical protein TVAG_163820 [Trichomonas vaginalis G3]|uniref:Uncharacterized protein n=1 Tax=Trichomonas vaginalis (strain ATCC PRA-98 / G3) TaxID=412133 RepID=A2DG59_TRIV3|nr:hypothetical protein TVAGG3_0953890 [Trichomonas vaginalis G3]EAY20686.1 hypothetical protein TVAG_163820 [Trichomonas vaginalis G3]KAI5487407.1 hypothetical protein TVAGG3_0953890 [Trichomonas vaginalis G3]|eukprot:XP_001581672.1 hypothetical protein [Trichomonas vaginalis G3]
MSLYRFSVANQKKVEEKINQFKNDKDLLALRSFINETVEQEFSEKSEQDLVLKTFEKVLGKIEIQTENTRATNNTEYKIEVPPKDLYFTKKNLIQNLKEETLKERNDILNDYARKLLKREEISAEKTYVRQLMDLISVIDSQNFTITHGNRPPS